MTAPSRRFVSRGGEKLIAALETFGVDVRGRVCADLGSNAGGFVDCLLQGGAARVYAIERGYGVLDYRLRRDARVVVMERTDALGVRLPEAADCVTIDVGWTRQRRILPIAATLLVPEGVIISLIKPHYEADPDLLEGGVLPALHLPSVLDRLRAELPRMGLRLLGETESPITGRGGNIEWLWHLAPASAKGA